MESVFYQNILHVLCPQCRQMYVPSPKNVDLVNLETQGRTTFCQLLCAVQAARTPRWAACRSQVCPTRLT